MIVPIDENEVGQHAVVASPFFDSVDFSRIFPKTKTYNTLRHPEWPSSN